MTHTLSFWRGKPLFFLHIHKTAGTSFIHLLDQCYTTAEICPSDWPYRYRLNEITKDEVQAAKFVRGHFPYDGIIQYFSTKPICLTFLREPVARFISHFRHLQRAEGDPPGVHERIKNLSLDEFVQKPELANTIANMGVRLLSGSEPDDYLDSYDLSLAQKRLESFEFIGLTEEFEKSLYLFTQLFGLPHIQYVHQDNVAPHERIVVDEKTIQKIAELNRADVILYEHGKRIFEQRYRAIEKVAPKALRSAKVDHYQTNFSKVDPGQGWYIGESHPTFGVVRWSGPETLSYLYLPPFSLKKYLLRFCVVNWLNLESLTALVVKLNGQSIHLKSHMNQDGSVVFEGNILAEFISQQNQNVLTFELPSTYSPHDVLADSQDKRLLGLCYAWLEISPFSK